MPNPSADLAWRQTHLGRLLASAGTRFEARVLALMAQDEDLALSLANLAGRGQLGASHVQITRHLDTAGSSLTALAARAGITKQAMGQLVDQCAAWNLVAREPSPRDARAIQVVFTPTGLQWLRAYERAVRQAEDEFRLAVGADVAVVVHLGLEAYIA